jgi:hypothetical protein
MSVVAHYDVADLALFAMQLLQSEQHQAIAAHLTECSFCRQELARLQGDLAAFAHTVELQAPAATTRDRLLHQIAREKKIAPVEPVAPLLPVEEIEQPEEPTLSFPTRGQSQSAASRQKRNLLNEGESTLQQPRSPRNNESDRPPARSNTVSEISPRRPHSDREEESHESHAEPDVAFVRSTVERSSARNAVAVERSSSRFLSTFFLWTGWIFAAGLALAGAKLYQERALFNARIVAQTTEIDRLKDNKDASARLLEVVTNPSAHQVLLTVSGSASAPAQPSPQGHILYVASQSALIFLANDLQPLDPSKVYELWLVPADGRDPIPAGVFHPDAKGNASVILPSLPRATEAKAFGVTIEDEGGSQTPTLPIVLAGS